MPISFVRWMVLLGLAWVAALAVMGAAAGAEERLPLYASDFAAAGYGSVPPGWHDLIDVRPSRNWAVDGKGLLRPMLKNYAGLIVYDGSLASGEKAGDLKDVIVSATFTK